MSGHRLWQTGCWESASRGCPRPVPFFFSSRRRHTRCSRDWSSDVCSSDLGVLVVAQDPPDHGPDARQVTLDEKVEIGRASCRGKSVDLGGRRIIKKKKEVENGR